MRRRREGLGACDEQQRCEGTAHLCVMSDAPQRAGGQWCCTQCAAVPHCQFSIAAHEAVDGRWK